MQCELMRGGTAANCAFKNNDIEAGGSSDDFPRGYCFWFLSISHYLYLVEYSNYSRWFVEG